MATPILNDRQFGILIAYVIPGFVGIHGLSYHVRSVAGWMGPSQQPTVAGFLYVTLASIACGLTISTVRWLTIDALLHHTGVGKADWSLPQLQHLLSAFEMFVLYSYRYYQFHANCFVALAAWLALRFLGEGTLQLPWLAVIICVEIVLLAGARDTLKKYYSRTNEILRDPSHSVVIRPDQFS